MRALRATARRSLHSVEAVTAMIAGGASLILAGEETLLASLPRGRWIGGTIPYFMTAEAGGAVDRTQIYVQTLPEGASVAWQGVLDRASLPDLAAASGPDNGYTILLLPSQSDVHRDFALNGQSWPNLFRRPLAGWVTGVLLDRLGIDSPKVFDGASGTVSGDAAVVMHVALPDYAYARIDNVNLFEQDSGPALTFGDDGDSTGFTVEWVHVDGVRTRLVDHIAAHGIDIRLPLVADYNGAMINVATAGIDEATGEVTFFAPVFPGMTYRFARPVEDYERQFAEKIADATGEVAFSCNCILNFNYAKLESKHTGSLTGPMSFGEIAYMLMTQTLVYLTIERDT